MAKHYVIIDNDARVLRGFSDDLEQPGADAICICENGGRHFEINGVSNPALFAISGDPKYAWIGGSIVTRKAEDLISDLPPPLQPTLEERTTALEAALLELVLGGVI